MRLMILVCATIALLALAGCSSSSGTNGNGDAITFVSSELTLVSGQTITLADQLHNIAGDSVTWSLVETGAGQITSGYYTAPTVLAPTTYHLRATSTSDQSRTGQLTLNIEPATTAILSLTYLDKIADYVGYSATIGSDGIPDWHFRCTITTPANTIITALRLNRTGGTETWDTTALDTWLLLPFKDSAPVITHKTTPLGTYSWVSQFDLYIEPDAGVPIMGQTFTLTLTPSTGLPVSKTLTVQ